MNIFIILSCFFSLLMGSNMALTCWDSDGYQTVSEYNMNVSFCRNTSQDDYYVVHRWFIQWSVLALRTHHAFKSSIEWSPGDTTTPSQDAQISNQDSQLSRRGFVSLSSLNNFSVSYIVFSG